MSKKMIFRVSAVFIGIIIAIAALEIVMRSTGALMLYVQKEGGAKPNFLDSKEIRIVCIGESTTARMTPPGQADHSWPRQLEEKLNTANPGFTFKVYNIARPAVATSFLYPRLVETVEQVKPHVVISMMGIDDNENFQYLQEDGLQAWRVVKLGKWLMGYPRDADQVEDPVQIQEVRAFGDGIRKDLRELVRNKLFTPAQVLGYVEEKVDKYPKDRWFIYFLASDNIREIASQYESFPALKNDKGAARLELQKMAFDMMVKGFELKPSPVFVNMLISLSRQMDHQYKADEVVALSKKAMQMGLALRPNAYHILFNIPKTPDEELLALYKKHGVVPGPQDANLWEVTRSVYRATADLAHEKNFAYFAMQYPLGSINPIKEMFAEKPVKPQHRFGDTFAAYDFEVPVEEKYKDVQFISNQNFTEVVTPNTYSDYFTDRFAKFTNAEWGHTTSLGHTRIADNAAQAVQKWMTETATK